MGETDRLLLDLLAADDPPERDPGFVVEVMDRIERRRLAYGLLSLTPTTVAAGAVMWAAGPVLRTAVTPALTALNGLALAEVGAVLALAAVAWIATGGRYEPRRI
jgi:hypothetical protein